MTDTEKAEFPKIRVASQPNVVQFDIVPTFGTTQGNVHIELAMRQLVPSPAGVHNEFIIHAGLRCSAVAAKDLRDAIDKALKMLEGPPVVMSEGSNALN